MERRAALHSLLSSGLAWLTGRRVEAAGSATGIAQRPVAGQITAQPRTFDVRNFGARGDGVTDDTAAIQAACNAAVAGDDLAWEVNHPTDEYGGSAMVVAVGTFVTSQTITIGTHFDGTRATFLVKGSPAIGVRVATKNDGVFGRRLVRLPEVINTSYLQPPRPTGIGVQVVNAQACEVHVRKVESWGTAIDVIANNNGTAWSRFYLGWILNNNIGLSLTVGPNGWVNENQFHGGAFGLSSGGVNIPGTRYIKVGRCNNNTFYSNALEGDPEYHIECAGRFNLWFMPRLETKAVRPKALFTSIGTPFTSGCDNGLFLGYPSSSGPIVVTNSGVGAERNNVIAWEPGPQGGLTFHGPQIFDRVASDNATMFVDDQTHRIGLGKMTPTERLDLRGNSNIGFGASAFLGQLFSSAGLVLGVNAKADTVGQVGNQVLVAQNDNAGYQFIRLAALAGISFHAQGGAVTAGAVADAEQMRLTPAGKLGLGTRTPAAKLAVNGGVHVGGDADPGDKNLQVDGGIKAPGLQGYSNGDRYLVVDAAGNIHVSTIGPGK
jgi:pectate lyase-like protein